MKRVFSGLKRDGFMLITRRDFTRLTGGLLTGAAGLVACPGLAMANRGPFYTAHVYPGSPITLSERALRERGETVIALTFDDGPDPVHDPQILRLLAAHKAVATFFVIGSRAATQLDLIKAMVDGGCEVGNHSWSHPMLNRLSAEVQLEEMRRTDALLASAGITAKWLRPPYGGYDAVTRAVAKQESLETILWSVDPGDWKSPPPETIVRRITGDMAPGAVILMHSTRPHSVTALPRILEYATANNFRFVTLSEWKRVMMLADPGITRVPPAAKPSAPG